MFWLDQKIEEITERFKDRITQGDMLVLRDEKTGSGRVHVGSMMSASIHGALSEALTERGIKNTYYYELNDTDPMDGLPVYLDENEYRQHMGKPLFAIPSPDGKAKNFAEYYGQEFLNVITETGFAPTFYRSSELYQSGRMNGAIRLALEHADLVRHIYKEVSGSVKPDDWLPLNVICERCGKVGTTKVTSFDGEKVRYVCQPKAVEWAEGCNHEGNVSPFDGNATLPWKVEWPAKFMVMKVDVESAGKDHFTKGGSRQVADRIAQEVFKYPAPYGFGHEFLLIGGKKMSSSKGAGASAREIADLLPPHIFRLLLLRNVTKQSNFDPYGDTTPVLFDLYDSLAEKYFNGIRDDETRLFEIIHFPGERRELTSVFLPRFSTVSFLVQMPHLNLEEEAARLKGGPLSDADRFVLNERSTCAKYWISEYAPEDYVYALQFDRVPEKAQSFTEAQKSVLKKILEYMQSNEVIDGQSLHTHLHEIRKESDIEPKVFFSALYQSFLGKDSGPKAGWFLSVLDRDFLIRRLKEVTI